MRCKTKQNFNFFGSFQCFFRAWNTPNSDDSYLAIAAVAYSVYHSSTSQRPTTSFIFGKARVAPLKQHTFTKLEIQAVLIGSPLSKFVKKANNFYCGHCSLDRQHHRLAMDSWLRKTAANFCRKSCSPNFRQQQRSPMAALPWRTKPCRWRNQWVTIEGLLIKLQVVLWPIIHTAIGKSMACWSLLWWISRGDYPKRRKQPSIGSNRWLQNILRLDETGQGHCISSTCSSHFWIVSKACWSRWPSGWFRLLDNLTCHRAKCLAGLQH